MDNIPSELFQQVTLVHLRDICRRHCPIAINSTKTRPTLLRYIASLAPPVIAAIERDVAQTLADGNRRYAKRKDSPMGDPQRRKVRRITTGAPPTIPDAINSDFQLVDEARVQEIVDSDFLESPSQEQLDFSVSRFIDATNNEALARSTCAACARLRFASDIIVLDMANLPNQTLLRPTTPHPAHTLFGEGLLLHTSGMVDDGKQVILCHECLASMKANKIPKFSLANDMWIGDIPTQLQNMTLPERILISRYFCAAFIVKLYPKQKGARNWASSGSLHSALRGNVSTYRLDPRQVAALMDGQIYPPSSKILSATIGVTFVGPKGVTERTMPSMFRVRRRKVQDALEWLKEFNPLYANITISQENLNNLPADAIPEEILSSVRYSDNIEGVEAEHAGYVPDDEDDLLQNALTDAGLEEIEDLTEPSLEPDIFPLHALGVVDIDGEDISSQELMSHALANTYQAEHRFNDDEFAIQRGSAFVNEYARVDLRTGQRNDGGPSNPNHLLGCFPFLFPYGRGGVETARPVNIPYETHVRWAMEYTDSRFRKDPQFPFQVFGVMQKRQVCRSAVLQMKSGAFRRNMRLISSLKPADLEQASKEETRGIPHRNPAMRALRYELSAVRTRVKGTDESRLSVRSKVWSTNLIFNPPSLWMTINPADTHDPIAQVLTGADIDLDAFCNTAGPDNVQRAVNIATDPMSSAQFFHLMINTVLEKVLGIKRHYNGTYERETGIVGKVQSYIGTVEAQGRGTLHFHCLIWLKDAPTAHELKAALKSDLFREKMKQYIETTVHADLRGRNREQVLVMPKDSAISYSRPLDPRTTSPDERTRQREALVRNVQFHKCSLAACLKTVGGRVVCKRRAPFALAREAWVDEAGNWGPKRLCDMLNGFNPALMSCIRANHDLKLILSGRDTATITYYITNYATKKQQRSSNVTALLAKSLAFSKAADKRLKDINQINRKLIIRCANSLTRYREFSGPEVMSYIMGWPDIYESHSYVTIFWDAALAVLKDTYRDLNNNIGTPNTPSEQRVPDNAQSSPLAQVQEPQSSRQTIVMVGGQIGIKEQVKDYINRGQELCSMSFLDFILHTYEGKSNSHPLGDSVDLSNPVRGRPAHHRVPYKVEANKPKLCRIFRTQGHETLPRFVGKWFPRNDCESEREKELYWASMLMLLEPWTELSQLKGDHASFKIPFDRMVAQGHRKIHTFLHNVQYFYECCDGAKQRREEEKANQPSQVSTNLDVDIAELHQADSDHDVSQLFDEITEEVIQAAYHLQQNDRDTVYARLAITHAIDSGIFEEEPPASIRWKNNTERASNEEMQQIHEWAKQLKSTTRNMTNIALEIQNLEDTPSQILRSVDATATISQEHEHEALIRPLNHNEIATHLRPKLGLLNREQRLAHNIVEDTLKQHLENRSPKQLRMLILGQGGTGKSMLIGAITETFEYYGQLSILAKCATTGIAATEIGGQTLHSWAGLSINVSKDENWVEKATHATQEKRKMNIEGKEVLIIDEISMADKKNLYAVSEIVGSQRAKAYKGNADEPFGGMHVILCGDFHQFPPVINTEGALYVDKLETDRRATLGRAIFKQFDTVVILKEQIRVKDQQWTDILNRLRVGECDEKDIHEIEKLVLGHPECQVPDFQNGPWSEAILVTPRHKVREMWNNMAVAKHCQRTGNVRFVVPAEDVDKDTEDVPCMRARLAMAQTDMGKKCKLAASLPLAVGMKAMVVFNISTEADLANGTRGTIEKITLDPREDPTIKADHEGVVKLKYPPAQILFRPDKPTHIRFQDVEAGLIPITPFETRFNVKHLGKEFQIKRRQYALTPGYAFTDYKSQGQTIEYVIIDIGKPPSGHLSPFGTYVALSRSRGRDNIRLLRDFDPQLFLKHPSPSLRLDMERMERLSEVTKEMHGDKW